MSDTAVFIAAHDRACEDEEPGYIDPKTGYWVMSSVYLLEQGSCCGSGCRHCPFDSVEQQRAGRPSKPCFPWFPREAS